MNPPTCRICGYKGELPCPVCWPGRAINKEERLTDAINVASLPEVSTRVASSEDSGVFVPPSRLHDPATASLRTPNRRNREDYNAYMKGYMARRREK